MILVHPTITPEQMASYVPRCWLLCCLELRLLGCGLPGPGSDLVVVLDGGSGRLNGC